jgi:hypothetical protein
VRNENQRAGSADVAPGPGRVRRRGEVCAARDSEWDRCGSPVPEGIAKAATEKTRAGQPGQQRGALLIFLVVGEECQGALCRLYALDASVERPLRTSQPVEQARVPRRVLIGIQLVEGGLEQALATDPIAADHVGAGSQLEQASVIELTVLLAVRNARP